MKNLLSVFIITFFCTTSFAQDITSIEKHIAHSIDIILKEDIDQWKKINRSSFENKRAIDSIWNYASTLMDYIRGYEAFKDYENLKLISIDKIEIGQGYETNDEPVTNYITAFIMQDSISGKNYGFIAEDMLWYKNKLQGFKIMMGQPLSVGSTDEMWQQYINRMNEGVDNTVDIVESLDYTGKWNGQNIRLEWQVYSDEKTKDYHTYVVPDSGQTLKLHPHTANAKDYLLLTEPYEGYFAIKKSNTNLTGYFYDTEGKKHKIKWNRKN